MDCKKVYVNNYGTLRMFNENEYKLSCMRFKCIKNSELKFYTPKGSAGNDEKLENNISRTKSRIIELGKCNEWDLFVTLTLNPKKYNRKDLGKFIKDLAQLIRDERKNGYDIEYLLIPERHKDGCWHMHGFIHGLPIEKLHEFSLSEHLPKKIIDKLKSGKRVFTWEKYAAKFGYSDIELIQNKNAASAYISKYITKDLISSVKELNAHAFYASKGLKSSEIIHQGALLRKIENPTYENDYVAVKWFADAAKALQCFEV